MKQLTTKNAQTEFEWGSGNIHVGSLVWTRARAYRDPIFRMR
jgi:hypothetical protein